MNHYRAIHASLLRHCVLTASKLEQLGLEGVSVLNLDAHTDESSWPDGHFLAVGEFHLNVDQVYEGSAALALGLTQDTNLLQSAEYMEVLLDDLMPNSNIAVIDPRSGEELGKLLIKGGVTVTPPKPTRTRPLLPIFFSFTSNLQAY